MTPAARISAAIEVLGDIEARRRPATDALKDWGLSHRFAGSKDRAALASLVYDALRRKSSAAWIMDEGTPRATVLGMLRLQRGLSVEAIAALCSGEQIQKALQACLPEGKKHLLEANQKALALGRAYRPEKEASPEALSSCARPSRRAV